VAGAAAPEPEPSRAEPWQHYFVSTFAFFFGEVDGSGSLSGSAALSRCLRFLRAELPLGPAAPASESASIVVRTSDTKKRDVVEVTELANSQFLHRTNTF
jgi:hypothetical protein